MLPCNPIEDGIQPGSRQGLSASGMGFFSIQSALDSSRQRHISPAWENNNFPELRIYKKNLYIL
jgi:hypothetical protein